MNYKHNRIKKLQYEFGESNLNSDELVSSTYRKEINQKYKEKQDIFIIDSVLSYLDPSVQRIIKDEVYQICRGVRFKDLCFNCKVEEIIAMIILYVWKSRHRKLREEQTRLWRVYDLSWRKYALVLGRLLMKHRENSPL